MDILDGAAVGALLGVLIFILGGKWELRKIMKEREEVVTLTLLDALAEEESKKPSEAQPVEEDKLRDQWENLMNYNGGKKRGE